MAELLVSSASLRVLRTTSSDGGARQQRGRAGAVELSIPSMASSLAALVGQVHFPVTSYRYVQASLKGPANCHGTRLVIAPQKLQSSHKLG